MSPLTEPKEDLVTQVEQKQLEVYHQIENWGCGLFLTGILLITKQLIDWRFEHGEIWIGEWLPVVPSAVGLYGYGLLLVVNFRARLLRSNFFGASKVKPRGLLGWLLALSPPLAGIGASLAVGGITLPLGLALFAFLWITFFAYAYDHWQDCIIWPHLFSYSVTVTGDKVELSSLQAQAKVKLFQSIIKEPKGLDWSERIRWRKANWGLLQPEKGLEFRRYDNTAEATMIFKAHAFPDAGVRGLCKRFPKLVFKIDLSDPETERCFTYTYKCEIDQTTKMKSAKRYTELPNGDI